MSKHLGIYKRGEIYWITYMLRGHQCFESSHSRKLGDAESLLLKRKSEISYSGIVVSPSKVPHLADLLESYVAQIDNPNTRQRYLRSKKVLVEYFGNPRISTLNAFAIDRFKDARIHSGVTPAGTNRELALLRSALNFAVQRRLVAYSPFVGVKMLNEAKYRQIPRILSFNEESALLASCDLRLNTLVVTLLETGMRVGIEALRLKWENVDFVDSTVTIVLSKTLAGRRTIPVTSFCKATLLNWRTVTLGISDYVFFNPQRPDTYIRSVKTAWHNALRRSGLPSFPLYNTRHMYATRLAAAGVQDTVIDQLLGHSRRDVLRFYTVRVPEYLRDAVTKLELLRKTKTEGPPAGSDPRATLAQIAGGSTLVN
jgi:integrase